MHIRSLSIFFISLALVMLTGACRAKKGATSQPHRQAQPAVVADVFDPAAEFDRLTATYGDWTDLSMPVKLQLSSPSRFSISGQAKIVNGKSIVLSLRMLGFEVASVYADADSIVAVSKIKGIYFSEPVSRLTARYGFTLADIQSLLLGRPFTPGKGTIRPSDTKDYTVEAMAETFPGKDYAFSFRPGKMPEWVSWMFVAGGKADGQPSLLGLTVQPDGIDAIDCVYGEVKSTPAGSFAPSLRLGTTFKNKELDAQVVWSFDRAQWNTGLVLTPPKIPSGCRRVSTEQLLKMLGTAK